MKTPKTKIHFTDEYLLNPTNPVTVNLIGAGGTGSKVLTALMEMNHSLTELNHAGLQVRLWDDDIITESNLGRQRFAESEIGLYKAVALINRANRWSGTSWSAETSKFEEKAIGRNRIEGANIYISCVDNVKSRFEIADLLNKFRQDRYVRNDPKYWLDFGNGKHTGQVILSTIGNIKQPNSKQFAPVGKLPFITEEFPDLLRESEDKDDTPSCSLAEALQQQDLFINSALAQLGCSLLWGMFRNGMTENRGVFLNLSTFQSQPIKVA